MYWHSAATMTLPSNEKGLIESFTLHYMVESLLLQTLKSENSCTWGLDSTSSLFAGGLSLFTMHLDMFALSSYDGRRNTTIIAVV